MKDTYEDIIHLAFTPILGFKVWLSTGSYKGVNNANPKGLKGTVGIVHNIDKNALTCDIMLQRQDGEGVLVEGVPWKVLRHAFNIGDQVPPAPTSFAFCRCQSPIRRIALAAEYFEYSRTI